MAWLAVRRYEHSYWAASVRKKIELKDNAKNEHKHISYYKGVML